MCYRLETLPNDGGLLDQDYIFVIAYFAYRDELKKIEAEKHKPQPAKKGRR